MDIYIPVGEEDDATVLSVDDVTVLSVDDGRTLVTVTVLVVVAVHSGPVYDATVLSEHITNKL